MTYTEFVARLTAAIGSDQAEDDGWAAYLPAIIEQAELRCHRDVDFLAVRKFSTGTLAPGVARVTTPTDWMLGQSIRLTASGITLDRRDETYLREFSGVGRPRCWAEPTQGAILLAPVPDTAYEVELGYHVRPAALSATNPTTWLATYAADLMFYAAMVATAGYLKNYGAQADDPRSGLSWEGQYQAALLGVRREEGRRKGDGGFDTSNAPPPSKNEPP